MAGCEPLVRALLLADPAVSAAVGGSRIYPLIRPQGSALPAITYQRVSRIRIDPLRVPADAQVQNARLQMDCWAATYGDGEGPRGRRAERPGRATSCWRPAPPPTLRAIAALPDERDLYESEPAPPVYRVSADYSVWWDED